MTSIVLRWPMLETARLAARVVRRFPLQRGKQRVANVLGQFFAPAFPNTPEQIHMSSGFDMHLALHDPFQRQMFFSGLYEPGTTRLFRRLLAAGDTMVDGGANIGYFSLLAAQCVGLQGAVHAFEPVPQTFATFSQNVTINHFPQIRANMRALSDHAGELELELPESANDVGFLGWAASAVKLGRGRILAVPMCALEDYADEHGITHIKLVKLDLEGHELAALRGMTRLLNEGRVTFILCEVNSYLLGALQIDLDAIRQFLNEAGYRCYQVDVRTGKLVAAETPIVMSSEVVRDFLFVAPGSWVRERLQATMML